MHQGSERGRRASPGVHAQLHPSWLASDPLSCHPPLLSPQMCSELDVLDPELLHSSNRTAPSPMHWEGTHHSSPPMLGVGLGPGWWVGARWEASVVLACNSLPWVFVAVSWGLQVPECNAPGFISDRSCQGSSVWLGELCFLGYVVPALAGLSLAKDREILSFDLFLAGVARMWMKGE
jgi:hypothetical protein